MTTEDKLKILNSDHLFENIPDSQLVLLAELTHCQDFAEDEILISQGDSTDTAYLIYSGAVKVYRINEEGVEITLAVKGEGQIIGEMSLLDGKPRSAYVQAIQPTKTLTLRRKEFTEFIFNNPQFSLNLLKSLILRFRELNQRYEDIFSKNLDQRTLITLETLSAYFPDREILLSHEELALIIGATRARVTEALQKLEHEGKITISHRKIRLN